MSEEPFPQRESRCKGMEAQRGLVTERLEGSLSLGDKTPRGPEHSREPTPGMSDHRDAPTSESPREETEGALSLRTCLTASAGHFRFTEGTGELARVRRRR